jgi:hypothetical protein
MDRNWPIRLACQMMFMKSSGHKSMCLLVYTPNLASLTILEFYTKKACKLPAASLVAQNRGSLCDRRHEFAHLTWCPYCKRQCWLAACDFMISAPKEGRASTRFFLDACVCHCLSTLALGCLPFFRVLWLSKNCTYSEIGFHQNIQNITHTHQQKHVT